MISAHRGDIGDMLRAVGECTAGMPLQVPNADAQSAARQFELAGSVLAIDAAPVPDEDDALPAVV